MLRTNALYQSRANRPEFSVRFCLLWKASSSRRHSSVGRLYQISDSPNVLRRPGGYVTVEEGQHCLLTQKAAPWPPIPTRIPVHRQSHVQFSDVTSPRNTAKCKHGIRWFLELRNWLCFQEREKAWREQRREKNHLLYQTFSKVLFVTHIVPWIIRPN